MSSSPPAEGAEVAAGAAETGALSTLPGAPPEPCNSSRSCSNSSSEISSILASSDEVILSASKSKNSSSSSAAGAGAAAGSGAGAASAGAGVRLALAGASSAVSGWLKRCKVSNSAWSAACKGSRALTCSNISTTTSVACRMTSINSGVRLRWPLRIISNTFSAP